MALDFNDSLPHEDHQVLNLYDEKQSKRILNMRTTAFLFDLVMVLIGDKLCMIYYTAFLENYFLTIPKAVQDYLFIRLNKLEIIIFAIIFWGYFTFCNFMMDGQTPGKVLLHLKVVNGDFSPLTFRQSLLRTLGQFVCYFSGSFLFLFPWFNKEQKGIADWLSGTSVQFTKEDRKEKKKRKSLGILPAKHTESAELTSFPGQAQSLDNPALDEKFKKVA